MSPQPKIVVYSHILSTKQLLDECLTHKLINQSQLEPENFLHLTPREGKSTISIDQVRLLRQQLAFSSFSPKNARLVLINDAGYLTLEAQNALLKTLEEPNSNTMILLTTRFPNQLIATIHSRCQLVYLREIKQLDKNNIVDVNLEHYNSSVSFEPKNYTQAIKLASDQKTTSEAVEYLATLLKNEEKFSASQCQLILKAIAQINHNYNLRLTLEQLYFQLLPSGLGIQTKM